MSQEILSKIRLLEIKSRRLASQAFMGEYSSAFKGQGMEFEEVREYCPGDDVRHIDWNVTARSLNPFVKVFREERELLVYFLLDVSASLKWASLLDYKKDRLAEIAALLSYLAISHHDKVGLLNFSSTVHRYLPAKKGKHQFSLILNEIYSSNITYSHKTDFSQAFDFFMKVVKKRSVCFILSDFYGFEQSSASLGRLATKHDVIALPIEDELEFALPLISEIGLEDLETNEKFFIHSDLPQTQELIKKNITERKTQLQKQFQKMNVDFASLKLQEDSIRTLHKLFLKRENHHG